LLPAHGGSTKRIQKGDNHGRNYSDNHRFHHCGGRDHLDLKPVNVLEDSEPARHKLGVVMHYA
jgi:hypothetical protein